MQQANIPLNRRKRVQRLKKIIVGSILLAVLIPIVCCVIMAFQLYALNKSLDQANEQILKLQTMNASMQAQMDAISNPVGSEQALDALDVSSNSYVEDEREGLHHVYLTFDDGPSAYTVEILDLLKAYDCKATFFVVGDDSDEAKAIYQRIVTDGHTIGVHSYSHVYSEIYASDDAFFDDYYMMSDYIYDVTGVRPTICRLPGGSSNTVSKINMASLVTKLNQQGVQCFDWNVSGKDAEGGGLSARQIADNVLNRVDQFDTAVVLLHDGRDKATTVDAVEMILQELTARDDVVIQSIDQNTPVILHISIEQD